MQRRIIANIVKFEVKNDNKVSIEFESIEPFLLDRRLPIGKLIRNPDNKLLDKILTVVKKPEAYISTGEAIFDVIISKEIHRVHDIFVEADPVIKFLRMD